MRQEVAALAESTEPAVRAAVDTAIKGDVGAADIELERVLEADTSQIADRWRRLGATRSLWSVGKAIEAYDRALEIDPTDFWTHVLQCRLLRAANRTDAAFAKAQAAHNLTEAGTRERGVVCDEIGDVLRAWNDLTGALAHYEEGLVIARDLAAKDPTNGYLAQDVSVSVNRIGDVLVARNDLAGALTHYEEALGLRRDLVANDLENATWARSVSVSLDRIGDVLRARNDLAGALTHYEESLSIARALAAKDPTNGEQARDVSVSVNKVGDVLRARNDVAGALTHYEEGLVIARDLAAKDPTNGERARDVLVSVNKIGDLLDAENDLSGSLTHYEEGLAIARDLAAKDPTNMEFRRDVWANQWRLAPMTANPGAVWDEIVAELLAMQTEGVLLPADEQFIEVARANAAAARAAATPS